MKQGSALRGNFRNSEVTHFLPSFLGKVVTVPTSFLPSFHHFSFPVVRVTAQESGVLKFNEMKFS